MNKKVAFHFPGQGSQSVGMMVQLTSRFPKVQEVFQRASDVLEYDLWALVQEGPVERLNQTEYTQPALLAADVAAWLCWKEQGGEDPVLAAGHSLGEYAALVAADAMTFEDAIACVALRGRAMQEAVVEGDGAMAAVIGLSDEQVTTLCRESSQEGVVTPANFNSLGQVVISGHVLAVDAAIKQAKAVGAKLAKRIPVSVPSHSPLMEPAAHRLSDHLKSMTIKKPRFPVIHNVDVKAHSTPDAICHALVEQLTQPVQWVKTVLAMQAEGMALFIECGPGKVLAGLNKRIVRQIPTHSIYQEITDVH